jgi:hypothetical protein
MEAVGKMYVFERNALRNNQICRREIPYPFYASGAQLVYNFLGAVLIRTDDSDIDGIILQKGFQEIRVKNLGFTSNMAVTMKPDL